MTTSSKKKTTRKPVEQQFKNKLVHINKKQQHGWHIYSVPDSRWATSKGFPDLILAHPQKELMIAVELKTNQGRLSAEQHIWLSMIAKIMPAYVWRPNDMEAITRIFETGDIENSLLYTTLYPV